MVMTCCYAACQGGCMESQYSRQRHTESLSTASLWRQSPLEYINGRPAWPSRCVRTPQVQLVAPDNPHHWLSPVL